MRVELEYDRAGLSIEIPDRNFLGVIEAPETPAPPAPEAVLREALARPLGAPPLAELARGKRSACLVIPDVTRPMPLRLALPPMLDAVERGGVPRDRILILIATGLHRPNEGRELEEMVGPEIVRAYRIENHVARDRAGHADFGSTSTGMPVRIDRRYAKAELKVTLGLVEAHFMAGFSGGRKLICPGLAAEETIRAFHSPALIEHPKSTSLVLEGNPTHATTTDVARRVGVDFSLNVVLDSRRRLLAAFAGGLEESFLAAAEQARAVVACPIPRRAEIVVTTGGGYPLDATWYQTVKGLVAALPAVKPGGTVLVASGIREGIGGPEFTRLIRETTDPEAFMRRIRRPGEYCTDQWQLEEFCLVRRQAEVMLYSDGLPREAQAGLFVTPVESVEAGLARAIARHGPDACVLAMPHGPYVLPVGA